MDVLADLLDGTRARGGLFNQSVLDPPWGLRIADRAPLALVTLLRGHAWLLPDDAPPARLETGDVALVRGADPYTVADDPATAPTVQILPGNVCRPMPGSDGTAALVWSGEPALAPIGVRTHGRPDGTALVVSGTYQVQGDVSGRLLAALPRLVVVAASDLPSTVVDMVRGEVSRDEPGQQVVLDRLLDLMLITTLRAWFARPEAAAPGWYRAQADPVVGGALRLLHENPSGSWTVAALAARAGVSRAAFARRFAAVVGEPPMSYLTGWRIALAADLLRETDDTIESVARKVGYANAFALSVAFKRVRGVSPSRHRGEPSASWPGSELLPL